MHVAPEFEAEARRNVERRNEDYESGYVPPERRAALLFSEPVLVPGFSEQEAAVARAYAARDGRAVTPRDYQDARGAIADLRRRSR